MPQTYSVTSAGVNPAEDRAHRMRMYFLAMVLRVLCVVSLFWVRGWWVLLVAAGAVILPWFAVMVGNAVAHGGGDAPDAPEPAQLEAAPEASGAAAASELIVVDVEPARRADSPGEPSGPRPAPSAPTPGTPAPSTSSPEESTT